MGLCPSLSPEERANAYNNKKLKALLCEQLEDLTAEYSFARKLKEAVPFLANRYLLNEGIFQDIHKVIILAQGDHDTNISVQSLAVARESFDDEVRNSCLILEDQIINKRLADSQKNQSQFQKNYKKSVRSSQLGRNPSQHSSKNTQRTQQDLSNNYNINTVSFQNNLVQNQSLVCQMNIIYEREFMEQHKYQQSLKLFLKWSNIFQEHAYGGFLKPLYRQFCQSLYAISPTEFDTIIDQTCVFVQFMVTVSTEIYQLRRVYESPSKNGELFKHQNIYNLIMSFLFKKTNIKRFFRKCIVEREKNQIQQFSQKLNQIFQALTVPKPQKRNSTKINYSPDVQFTFNADKLKVGEDRQSASYAEGQEQVNKQSGERAASIFSKHGNCEKLLAFFQVQPKFRLSKQALVEKDREQQNKAKERQQYPEPGDYIQGNTDIQSLLNIRTRKASPRKMQAQSNSKSPKKNKYPKPYSSCDKLLQNLCESGQTPITKLKIIVSISKNITKDIYEYYDRLEKNVPDLDPDNLTGIIMYLIVRCGKVELFEQLRMVEYFTTSNCLTCISGYYLNTFNAAIQTLLGTTIDRNKLRLS